MYAFLGLFVFGYSYVEKLILVCLLLLLFYYYGWDFVELQTLVAEIP
jgi:hypothetical protein